MYRDRLARSHRVDALIRLSLDAHLAGGASERRGQVRNHRGDVRHQLRLLSDHHYVDIDDGKTGRSNHRRDAFQQVEAVRILPGNIGVGEVTADVASAGGTENCVGDGVTDG